MTNKNKIIYSIILAIAMIVGAFSNRPADAQLNLNTGSTQEQNTTGKDNNYEQAGTIESVEVCCNGLKYETKDSIGGGVTGSFIFPWENMIPIPQLGIGLYKFWEVAEGVTVAGNAKKGGQCISIASECEDSENVDYTTKNLGSILEGDGTDRDTTKQN